MTGTLTVDDTTAAVAPDDSAIGRATIRRVSLRLLPFLFVLYICAHIDRANVGIAALQMNRDLRFSAAVYSFGAGIFYLGYALFEVPSNLVLARVGARRWIARIMITWGALASAMMFVRTPASFYILRFLLGAAEAGFFPGVVFYLTAWFPAADRARAVSRFMLAVPVASVLSGAVAGPLLGLQGRLGLAGWQWLFLLEGLPSVVLGATVLAYLVDSPEAARWLAPEQRTWLTDRLRREHQACAARHGASLRRALATPMVWQLGIAWAMAFVGTSVYLFWAPQLIRELSGRSVGWIGGVLAAIAFTAGLAMLFNAVHSDRSGERWLHVAVPFTMTALAWLVIATSSSPTVKLVGLAIAYPCILSIYGPFWCLPSTFLTGEAAAGGLALVSSIGALGGFLGPNLLGAAQQATGSPRAGFFVLAALAATAACLVLRLRATSRSRATA